jgi:acyl carrier protein
LNETLLAQGIGSIPPERGLRALEAIPGRDVTEVGVLAVDWSRYAEQFSWYQPPTFLADLLSRRGPFLGQSAAAPVESLQQIVGAPMAERRRLLSGFAAAQAVRVLGLESSHTIKPDQPLRELGLDSLLALELRNVLSSGLGLKKNLPATLLFDYPTLDALVDYLAREILGWRETAPHHPRLSGKDTVAVLDLESLSDEEAEVLLLQELESGGASRNG